METPMPETEVQQFLIPPSRRRFLAQLGIFAGLGVLTPFMRMSLPRKMQRIEVGRPALGTWVRIVIQDTDPERANRAAELAFAAIQLVDSQMSIHRPDSQIVRVNAAAGKEPIKVDVAVLDVVEMACKSARRTSDTYDPTVLPLMKLYGFYESGRETYPSDRQISETLDMMGHRHVIIDHANGKLGLSKVGVALDLGSIGKGWALDRAIDAIRATGVTSALVDVGGNVYALGAPQDSDGWSIGVVHPVSGSIVRSLMLRDTAVATSANNEQYRMLSHIRVGHLFNAKSGCPSDGHLSVTVTAKTGVQSDMLSTVAFLLGSDKFRDFPGALESHFIG
jgi:thiamine biosynthesis lipoprotein